MLIQNYYRKFGETIARLVHSLEYNYALDKNNLMKGEKILHEIDHTDHIWIASDDYVPFVSRTDLHLDFLIQL